MCLGAPVALLNDSTGYSAPTAATTQLNRPDYLERVCAELIPETTFGPEIRMRASMKSRPQIATYHAIGRHIMPGSSCCQFMCRPFGSPTRLSYRWETSTQVHRLLRQQLEFPDGQLP